MVTRIFSGIEMSNADYMEYMSCFAMDLLLGLKMCYIPTTN